MTSPRVRRVQTGRRRAWILPAVTAPAAALAATLLALILVGTVAGTVLGRVGPTGLVDQPTETFLVTHRTAWLTDAMRLVTDLGAAAVLVPLILVAGLGWRWRRGSWRPLALLGGAAAGAWAVQVAVKRLVERPRPPAGLALSHATGFAFPSGHATDAAAVYGMLAVLLARPGRRAARAAALLAAVGVIALVGLSRLYLGVHWLTDVAGGVGLGAAWLVSLILVVGTSIELPTRPGSKRTARFRQRTPGQSGIVRCQAVPADRAGAIARRWDGPADTAAAARLGAGGRPPRGVTGRPRAGRGHRTARRCSRQGSSRGFPAAAAHRCHPPRGGAAAHLGRSPRCTCCGGES